MLTAKHRGRLLRSPEDQGILVAELSQMHGDFAVADGGDVFGIWIREPSGESRLKQELAFMLMRLQDEKRVPEWLTGQDAIANILLGNFQIRTFHDYPGCLVLLYQGTFASRRETRQGISNAHELHTLPNHQVSSRLQDLEGLLEPESRSRLVALSSLLPELVLTPPDEARQRLETYNVARQRFWGEQVTRIPILRGSADSVFCALLQCVVDDYAADRVTSLSIEKVPAPATDNERAQVERARRRMRPDLDESMRDYYEKKMMKHMQQRKGGEKSFSAVQEIDVKLRFSRTSGETIGSHRIRRVSEDWYYFMPCSRKG